MTELVPPPEDPYERLKWARGLLRRFSGANKDAVSADEIRALAKGVIRKLERDNPEVLFQERELKEFQARERRAKAKSEQFSPDEVGYEDQSDRVPGW